LKLVGCKAKCTKKLPNGQTVECEEKFRNPVPVKTMMAGLGMPVGSCRKPLGKMTKSGVEMCRSTLITLYKNAPEYLAPIGNCFGINISDRLKDDAIWCGLARS